MRKLIAITTVVLAFAGTAAAGSDTRQHAAQPSLAFKLATLDCNCHPSRALVVRYRTAIKALKSKCKEKPGRYVRLAYGAKTVYEGDTGKQVSSLAILRGTRTALKSLGFRTSCGQVMAALIILMEKGG